MENLMPEEVVEKKIYLIRGHRVMLDSDLALLYGVTTKSFNKSIRRNMDRFPEDFMIQLTHDEFNFLRFQIGTSKKGRGGRRYLPLAFTEQGVAMLSSILNSKKAIQVNIAIMRTFVKLRQILSTHKDLAQKLDELEKRIKNHDTDIGTIFEAIRQLMEPPPEKAKRRIGFKP